MELDSDTCDIEDELELFSLQDMVELCEHIKSEEFTPENILEIVNIIRNTYLANQAIKPGIRGYRKDISRYFGGPFINLFEMSGSLDDSESTEETYHRTTAFSLDLVALLLIREKYVEESLDNCLSPYQLASADLGFFDESEESNTVFLDPGFKYETREAKELYNLLKREKYYEFFFDMGTFDWEAYGITYLPEDSEDSIELNNPSGIPLPKVITNMFPSFSDRLVVPLSIYTY